MSEDEKAILIYLRYDRGEEDLPDWYKLIQMGRYLGIPPWEVEKAPEEWMERIWMAVEVEERVRKDLTREHRSQRITNAQRP